MDALAALTARHAGSPDAPVPVDATDRLLLAEAAAAITAAGSGRVAVIDDRMGALTLGAAQLSQLPGRWRGAAPDEMTWPGGAEPGGERPKTEAPAPVRVHQDLLTAERALAVNARALGLDHAYAKASPGPELLEGARVVLMVLPRSLAALREAAQLVAEHADPGVVLFGGGRVKHMTPAMNDVLRDSFVGVRATLARGKSRVLVASGPALRRKVEFPAGARTDLGLVVRAHGAAFAGNHLDPGTRALLNALEAAGTAGTLEAVDASCPIGRAAAGSIVDLGCGTGLLAAWAAQRWPSADVVAVDASWAAVASAAATAAANDVAVRTVRDDAGDSLAAASIDVVLCNPPFHEGAAVRTDVAHRMFASAGRLLRPGGRLYCVWNSHLRYRPALERAVGPTDQLARDRRFTVTVSRRRA